MQAHASKFHLGPPITASLYLLIVPRHHDTGILIPAQQRILAVLRLAILHVCPAAHEVLVRPDAAQLARDGPIDSLHGHKVRWEHDIEVALVNLFIA